MKEEINEEELFTNFVTDNPELDLLEKLISEFNPFSVLNITHHEIRHSNVLAWLLNPNENHGLGDIFLRKVIIHSLKGKDGVNFGYSIADFIKCQFGGVKVTREYRARTRYIDILVECWNPRFIMIIENKLRSKESELQTKYYYDHIVDKFPNVPVLGIFLTTSDEDNPSDSRYIRIFHEDVIKILTDILDLHKDDLNPKQYEFINYFLKSIEEEVMGNSKIQEYARAIYNKHGKAIEKIREYAEVTSSFEEAVKKFYEKNNTLEQITSTTRSNWTFFVPEKFKTSHNIEMEEQWHWPSQYPIICWFKKTRDDKLCLVIEVGPIVDKDKRNKLMERMKGFKELVVREKGTSHYTRIYSKYIKFEEWDYEEYIIEKMEHLFNSDAKSAVQAVEKVISDFDWSK